MKVLTLNEAQYNFVLYLSDVLGIEIYVFYFSTSVYFIDLLRTKMQKVKAKAALCMNCGRAPNLTKISV